MLQDQALSHLTDLAWSLDCIEIGYCRGFFQRYFYVYVYMSTYTFVGSYVGSSCCWLSFWLWRHKSSWNKSENHKCLMANTYNNNNNESHDWQLPICNRIVFWVNYLGRKSVSRRYFLVLFLVFSLGLIAKNFNGSEPLSDCSQDQKPSIRWSDSKWSHSFTHSLTHPVSQSDSQSFDRRAVSFQFIWVWGFFLPNCRNYFVSLTRI